MIEIYLSQTTDPWLNLAMEDWLFRQMDLSSQILFLWRNEPSVVIGRFQNPWIECDVDKMAEDEVHLVRRQSGGGTVFHDLGNTNFTFLSPAQGFDKLRNLGIIVQALGKLGIEAEISPRNDIIVEGFKVSGSAFKQKKDRCFHHGTLLVDADLKGLSRYLHAPERDIKARGVASVRSRVINLSEYRKDLDHVMVCGAAAESFCGYFGGQAPVRRLSMDNLSDYPGLQEYYREIKSWEWRFGKTPSFVQRISMDQKEGCPDLEMRVKDGRILEISCAGDTEGKVAPVPGEWSRMLAGVRYHRRDVEEALRKGGAGGTLIARICGHI